MRLVIATAALACGLAVMPAAHAADDAAIGEIRKAWDACTQLLNDHPEAWIGWRQDFMNGYGNNFLFYDNRFATGMPTVLVREISTDGIFFESITSCYRESGSLAFIFTQATSPNYADGGDMGPQIYREGRIYFDESGEVIQTLGRITDDQGTKVVDGLDNDAYMLARGCSPVTVHADFNSIETEYFNKLGDIEGNNPPSTGIEYDWCANATGG